VYHLPGAAQLREGLRAGAGGGVWADRLLFCAASVGGGVLLSHLFERPPREGAEVTPAVG
jgi:hypothetical protein